MSSETVGTTTHVQQLLHQLATGDPAARDALIDRSLHRVTALARRQLREFPAVARWEQADDIVQGVAQRLHRALLEVRPASPREFFALSSTLIRRELIDLKRRLFGPEGLAAHHASPGPDTGGSRQRSPMRQRSDSTHDPAKLARWTELHDAIRALPDELREVFDLLWYQELTHAEAADVLGVSAKTISRRWRESRLKLHHLLEGGGV